MARYSFKLPDIGEGIAESEIAQWRVAVGDVIAEDQPLVDMLTDKAAVEIPSPVAGTVVELCGAAGDRIAVGATLLVIETAAPTVAAPTPPPVAAVAAPAAASAAGVSIERPAAAPTVRKRARELGIDLHTVRGSGPSGRILHEDLQRHCSAPTARSTPAAELAVRDDGIETIKVIGLRRKIAEAMQRSKQRIPHFAYVEEVDVTELEALRQHLNATRGAVLGKLTLLPFVLTALVRALPRFPQINATYDDEAGVVRRYRAVHAGVATQTANGLVVPVLRHAETLDLWQMAREIKRLAEVARSGKASREELSGSSITVTSLGALGGIVSTPVINAPEVAVIGVNKMAERPVVRNGQIVVRTMMNLSSSFDHRIVDGFDAAAFIQEVKALLEHPATLFIAPG